MEEETESSINNSKKTDRPWLFKKGQSGNPHGRPPGKTLKQYTREMLAAMTNKERQEFLHGLPKEVIWRLAEGNPSNDDKLHVDIPSTLIEIIRGTTDKRGDQEISREDTQ